MRNAIIFAIVAAFIIGGAIYLNHFYLPKQQAAPANESAGNTNQTNPTNTSMDQLQITDVKVGTGPAAKAGDKVTVNYVGTFADGRKFDSSYDRNQPFTFTLGASQVIQGWDQGVAGMQVGGERKLVVPPSLGYGPNDYGPIPGNSTLYFTVELLKIGG